MADENSILRFRIARLTLADEDWPCLRRALWPGTPDAIHRAQIGAIVSSSTAVAHGCFRDQEELVGFAEASVHREYVNGCKTTPAAFLEGIFVDPGVRRLGVARRLVETVRLWAVENGCSELASDAALANTTAHRLHEALGFAETERVVFYRTELARTSTNSDADRSAHLVQVVRDPDARADLRR